MNATDTVRATATIDTGRHPDGGGQDLPLPRLIGMGGSLLTADQVASMLGVPRSWVYEQSRRGRIPTVTLGRYRRYRAEAISDWVRRLEAGEEQI